MPLQVNYAKITINHTILRIYTIKRCHKRYVIKGEMLDKRFEE